MRRIPKEVEAEIEDAATRGVQIDVVLGTKHVHYILNGVLVTISPLNGRLASYGNKMKNTVAKIRRAVRTELEQREGVT